LRSRTIRLGIFISTLIIAAIVIFQLVWLRKVYNFEQREFDHRVTRSIRGYYEDVHRSIDSFLILNEQILRINNETYLFRSDLPLHMDSVSYFIRSELQEENISTECTFGVYDARRQKYTYTHQLNPDVAIDHRPSALPLLKEPFNYITLYFPNRTQYILSLMNFWLISSALLLVVLVLFGGSLYYFYKQKFLNETQKDFVNNFTHEFKTPVAVINLAAEVLENPGIAQKPERLSRYAAIVKYQGKYLQEQIERLLKYAYSESNFLHIHRESVDLHELIRVSLDNLQPLVEEKNAEVACDLIAKNSILFADHGYLLTVITNLVENALKYAQTPKIIISTANENGYVVLSVKDNGKGIEKRNINKIFNKFYRVQNGDQVNVRGFGLGLSFVRRIVAAHLGRITVESIPGIGSNFIVKLPVSR
jgi:two-component system phosphate regulon sensor histidine kinase PhoR